MTIVTEVEPGSKPFARMRLRKRASLAAIAGPGGAQFTFDNGCSQGENGGAIEAPARAAWLQFPSADVTAFAIPCGLPSLQTTAWPSSRRCCVSRAGSSFARPPWDLPTMNSVSRDPRLPQRHFICTSGHRRGRRRPVRRDRHPSRDGTPCTRHAPGRLARHRAQRRQLVHVWPDLRHQRPSTTTSFHARRPVGAAERRAAFTVPSTTVVVSACRTFSSGIALAAAWSSIGYHSVTSWRVSSTSSW
jgi:hypothetical protein